MSGAAPRPGARGRGIRTAAITNLGCKVNQAEMDVAARLLRSRGIAIVADGSAADLHVVNTCTVTAVADAKSRQAVRRARRLAPGASVVVTGCSVQLHPTAFAAADPAARLVDNASKDRLLAEIDALLGPPAAGPGPAGPGGLAGPLPTLSGVELDGAWDDRATVDRTRAYVKVQDGCSFFCTYCIIPRARGPERSLPPEAILADVRRALRGGHREIVLTGINIGTYDGGSSERGFRGARRDAALTLAGLIRRIVDETDVERIRLSSIEPQHVDDALLAAWSDGAGRCLPHFHLPLQSGDDRVLRRMGRRYDSAGYASVVARVRQAIPGVAVHADVITGFPTEDDAAWARSLAFIRSLDLAGFHVFRYSARPGTAATRMLGQVDEPARKARAAELIAVAAACRARFAAAQVGTEAEVLFESRLADGRWVGHAPNHVLVAVAPPADRTGLENVIGRVSITGVDPEASDRLSGRIVAVAARPSARRGTLPVLDPSATLPVGAMPAAGGPNGGIDGR